MCSICLWHFLAFLCLVELLEVAHPFRVTVFGGWTLQQVMLLVARVWIRGVWAVSNLNPLYLQFVSRAQLRSQEAFLTFLPRFAQCDALIRRLDRVRRNGRMRMQILFKSFYCKIRRIFWELTVQILSRLEMTLVGLGLLLHGFLHAHIVLVKHIILAEWSSAFWLWVAAKHRIIWLHKGVESTILFIHAVIVRRVINFTGKLRDLPVVLVVRVRLFEEGWLFFRRFSRQGCRHWVLVDWLLPERIWLHACPCGSDVLESTNKEWVLFGLEEEFEDHQHHVLLVFELVSQDLSFFFFDTAVRTHFI